VLFIGSIDGKIYELDFDSGVTIDAFTFKRRKGSLNTDFVVRGVAYDNGIVYALVGHSLYAIPVELAPLRTFNLGDPQWSYNLGAQVYGAPVIANGTIYVGCWSNKPVLFQRGLPAVAF
jgi:outer membrane protein assembly factor BamB